MKQTVLLFLLAPFMALAQLNPQIIPGYQNPNDWNKPLDSAYVPGKIYRVDSYYLPSNQSEMKLSSHYLIETDENFMLKRQSRYMDNITEYTKYSKYVSDYTYHNNKLVTITESQQKVNETILNHSATDSLFYKAGLLSIKDRWTYNIDSGTVKHVPGSEYLYDSLNRLIEHKPYNFNTNTNVIYSGFYTVDSFTQSSLPAKISLYSFPEDLENNPDRDYKTLLYDSTGKLFTTNYYIKFAHLEDYLEFEGTVYFYTPNRPYPDSIIAYSLLSISQDVSYKKVFIYTPTGHIAEILTYTPQGRDLILTGKDVYTPLVYSSLKENTSEATAFQLYPNPNQGRFTLHLPEAYSSGTISIFNVVGAKVYEQSYENLTSMHVDETFTQGVYSVTIKNEYGAGMSKKLLIH